MSYFSAISIPLPLRQKDGVTNRASFELPADGFIQVLPRGEHPHKDVGIQVMDDEALNRIKADFDALNRDNWTGMLVDRDHFSHDSKLPTDALAWADSCEIRPDGLWAKVRWTSLGEDLVTGGVLRLTSPVLEGFEDLGNGRKRPTRMTRIALTNDPNIKGMAPVTNRDGEKPMDYKKALCRALNLPETSTDDELEAGIGKLKDAPKLPEVVEIKNRLSRTEGNLTTVTGERDSLAAEVTKLREAVADTDLERLGSSVKNRDSLRKRLIADRDGTLALLKDAGIDTKVLPKPVHNRNGRNPGNPDVDDDSAEGKQKAEDHAVAVGIRAREIIAKNRMSLADAYPLAERQIHAESAK